MPVQTTPPIAYTDAELRARIGHLERQLDRAHDAGRWQEAEEIQDALDICRLECAIRAEHAEAELLARESAERGAREREALARHLDAYEADREEILASVYERR